ncbi:MAG: REP-associated tyrosine transposase [Acidobacteriaceae bacterium]
MSIPKRHSSPDRIRSERTFFVTSATWSHRALLQSDANAILFIDVLFAYRAQGRYALHALVVMPDHFHALLTASAENSIERIVQYIKGGFSFRASRELGRRGEFWQKGFSEVSILSFERFSATKQYIHQNPIRRGLCVLADEYPYSSANRIYELDPVPLRLKPLDL